MRKKQCAELTGEDPSPDEVAALVLEMLLERHPALVATEELLEALAHPYVVEPVAPCFIDEGVDVLLRAGLAHKLHGGFVFATHSAVRAKELRR